METQEPVALSAAVVPTRPRTPFWALGGVAMVFFVHAVGLACVAEDSFISFRFARHLASGQGLVWNLGEAPVEGFTNLLWVLLAALAELLHLDVASAMQGVGVVAGVGVLWLADRFAARILRLEGLARIFPTLLLAVSGPLATWAASGLETVLFTLLALAALYWLEAWSRSGVARDLVFGWLAVGLATLTRPEGALLAVVAVWPTLRRRDRRSFGLRALAIFGLFLAGLTAFRLAYFGVPLPNTFYAKTGGGLAQLTRGGVYFGFFAFHFLLPLLPWVLLGRGFGALREIPPREHNQRPAVEITLAVWCLAYAAYVMAVGGDYMAMDRFFVPILPALYLLAGGAAGQLFAAGPRPLRRWAGGALALALAGTLIHSTPLEEELFAKAPRQHGTFRGVETERWHVRRLALLAEFFNGMAAGRPEASLATRAIGVLGYRTDLAILDFHGLVNSRIARQGRGRRPLGSGLPGHEKVDYGYILDQQPTWWMFSRRLRDHPAGWPRYDPETDRRLHREYGLRSVYLEDPLNGEAGYFTFLERKDAVPEGFLGAGSLTEGAGH